MFVLNPNNTNADIDISYLNTHEFSASNILPQSAIVFHYFKKSKMILS